MILLTMDSFISNTMNSINKGLIDPEFLTSENTTGYWPNSQAFFNGRMG
ncbi:hypothetical protein [Paenibacillus sp. NPDC093718]